MMWKIENVNKTSISTKVLEFQRIHTIVIRFFKDVLTVECMQHFRVHCEKETPRATLKISTLKRSTPNENGTPPPPPSESLL